jgi:excisionase family DNA binding protein
MAGKKLAVTVSKAAELVEVGRSTGYAYVASGEWPSIRIGRSHRVPVAGLRAWVKRRSQTATVTAAPTEGRDLTVDVPDGDRAAPTEGRNLTVDEPDTLPHSTDAKSQG